MTQFYTYAHKRADDGKIFYIGKGKNSRHMNVNNRNRYWQNIANKHGFTAEILAEWKTEVEAFEHEKLLISCFRDMGYELANLTDGGEGTSGMVYGEDYRKRRSELAQQQFASLEVRARIGEQTRQRYSSSEYRDRMSESLKKAFADPEVRARLSEKAKQRWSSPEARARFAEEMRKRFKDPEYRARHSEAQKRRFANTVS